MTESADSSTPPSPRPILITGAAGHIGSAFASRMHDQYHLRLMVRGDEKDIDAIRPFGEVVQAQLTDLPRLKELCQGIDTVIHLAADASPSATWSSLLPNNIIGTYNVFVAAKSAGCRRVIFASSIHAVGGYPPDMQIRPTDAANPGDLYGVSKSFGEALARYMANFEGISSLVVRIGAFASVADGNRWESAEFLDSFIAHEDMCQLLQRCIEVENLPFALLHAVGDNTFKKLDLTETRELVGYQPRHDPTAQRLALKKPEPGAKFSGHRSRPGKSGLREDL